MVQQARQYYLPKLEGIDSLQIRTSDVPTPKANQVLVKIYAVALNYRDLVLASNVYPDTVRAGVVPCSDGAGEVVVVGEDVRKWKAGDRVSPDFGLDYTAGDANPLTQENTLGGMADGTLSEYQVFPESSLVRIPDHLSYEEASTLPCAAVTAWNALHGLVPVKAGDYVLVQGTGGVSTFALQFAAASGATVIVTSSSNDKLAKAKQLGARHLINYKEHPDWEKNVREATHGQGVDHIVEVGGATTMEKSLSCLRRGGWIHVVGFLGGMKSIPAEIVFKTANVRGILVGSRAQFEDMNRAVSELEIRPVVDSVFEFEDAASAYRRLQSQKHVGKVVIRVAKA